MNIAKDVYRTHFYLYNGSDLFKFTQENGAELAPVITDAKFYYSSETDVVSFVGADGAAQGYYFDCEGLQAAPTEIAIVEGAGTVSFDKAKADYDGVQLLFDSFMGKWGNENETITIDMYDSPFTFA